MSFIPYHPESHFSINNIPFGVFSLIGDPRPRIGTIIGNTIIDISILAKNGILGDIPGFTEDVYSQPTLNALASLPFPTRRSIRLSLQNSLKPSSPFSYNKSLQNEAFHDVKDVKMHLPVKVGDYTDFCASENHTLNCGKLLRVPGPPLPTAWPYLPIGYHGRASSVVISGTPIRRPRGIRPPFGNNGKEENESIPTFGPTRSLDVELEMGMIVGGQPNELGECVDVDVAEERIFGLVLMNDWSARDHQGFEMIPLGPFNGKNFGTSISGWVVMLDALESVRTQLPERTYGTKLFPYLQEKKEKTSFDIRLEIRMRSKSSTKETTVVRSNYKYLTYSFPQMLAHHTISGCPLLPGDLLGSGTISGPTPESVGSFLELSKKGEEPFELDGGEKRVWLEDGDWVELVGEAGEVGGLVGFGGCEGVVLPAILG